MKISKILMAVALLAALEFSGVASAHDYSGTLGSAATATDRWYVVCPRNTGITYQIQRTSRTAGTAAHVKLKFDATGIISGPTTGAATITAMSPLKTTAIISTGIKFFTINKTAAGAVSYRVRLLCFDRYAEVNPGDVSSVQTYVQNQ